MEIYKCLLNFLPQAVKIFTACPFWGKQIFYSLFSGKLIAGQAQRMPKSATQGANKELHSPAMHYLKTRENKTVNMQNIKIITNIYLFKNLKILKNIQSPRILYVKTSK